MKPMAWSHTALSGFETCPRQFSEVKVLRHFQEKQNDASMWGDRFHKVAENYIDGVCNVKPFKPLGPDMLPYSGYFAQFFQRPGKTFVERQYALTAKLVPCAFFDKATWCRGIIDVLTLNGHVADVDDHKTGKNRKKDMQQLIIFALLVFYHHPEIDTVRCAFHWVQQGFGEDAKDREIFYRHQIPDLWNTLVPKLERYKAAFDAGIFQPKPSGLCKKYCVVDTCEYWGQGRR